MHTLGGVHVPQFHQFIVRTSDGALAVGTEARGANPVAVPSQGREELAGGKGKDLCGLVVRAGEKYPAVRGEVNAAHRPRVSPQLYKISLATYTRSRNVSSTVSSHYTYERTYAFGAQRRTVLSFEAEATTSPSGEN